jgi:hypothetical protein
VLFETADDLVNRTGRGGENYGESSANDSLLHPAGPAVRQHPEGWLRDRRLRRAACRTGTTPTWGALLAGTSAQVRRVVEGGEKRPLRE